MTINFRIPSCQQEPLMVRIWPDDEWVLVEDFNEADYANKSDDYQDVDINDIPAFLKLSANLRQDLLTEIFGY